MAAPKDTDGGVFSAYPLCSHKLVLCCLVRVVIHLDDGGSTGRWRVYVNLVGVVGVTTCPKQVVSAWLPRVVGEGAATCSR